MARVKIQITTPSNNVIKVSPGVSALSSVQLYLNELIDVNTQHGADGYVLTQQADGTFAMEAVATTLADLSDTNIPNPQGGDSLVYDANTQKWVPGGVKSVNGQEGDVVITIPSPPPTPGISGLADTNITNLQDDQIIRYDSASGKWLNEDLEALPSGGTTGQALVKASNTDYDVTWDDIAVDVQFHQRYATEAETLRSGATETVELYFFAQGDGNGLAESASSDTPTSGYDIRRKLYYAEKAQADPDTSADWTQFTAIADNTTFNNAKAALLAYLKERTGGTVPISLKMTWEEVSQTAYLLDQSYGSGAEAAYSTRQLRNAATDCMVIRRASDSTTTTIGFDGSGNIDESAITTFCTGTTCTVVTWKDQSGNGNDATAASGQEPTIYTGGALVKENGKVAVQFDGSDDGFPLTLSGLNVNNLSVVTVCKSDVTSGDKMQFTLNTGSNGRYWHYMAGGNDTMWYGGTVSISHGRMDTNQRLRTFIAGSTSGAARSFLNGTEGPTTRPLVSATLTANEQFLGNYHTGSFYWDGNMQEFIVWGADQFNNRTSIESNIADYFTQNTPLLDTYSGAAAAYSLRLLDSTYTGSAVEVYNGSSYADIGFNVFGELDTVALAAHCGSNNGFVSKWYDQSGNSNDAAQATTANMPKIYDGTTGVITENGKPAVEFDGTQYYLEAPDSSTLSFTDGAGTDTYISAFATFKLDSVATNSRVLFSKDNGSPNREYAWGYFGFTDEARFFLKNQGGNDQISQDATTPTQLNLYQVGAMLYDASETAAGITMHINGVASTMGNAVTATYTGMSNTTAPFRIGAQIASNFFSGIAQEIILYASDQTSNRTGIEDNINTFYSIY